MRSRSSCPLAVTAEIVFLLPPCLRGERERVKTKSPLSLYASAGLKHVLLANSAAHPRRRAMRVMAMMMVASRHELFKLRDRARPVNSKELMGRIGIHDGVHLHAIWSRSTRNEEAC
jgi:hypothetical protein